MTLTPSQGFNMNKYQVQYVYFTKTFVDDFYALTHDDLLVFFDNVSACEVLEIREYVYEDDTYPLDDGNYIKYATVQLWSDASKHTFRILRIKKTLSEDELLTFVKTFIKVKNSIPQSAKLTYKY